MNDQRRKPEPRNESGPQSGPALKEQDWEAIESGAIEPGSVPENGDLRYDPESSVEAPYQGEDNPYQKPDEALPDDEEEAAISRNPSGEGGRFDEV